MIENLLDKNKKSDLFSSFILVFVIIILLSAVCCRFFFTCSRVDGDSMMNTLRNDQYVILLQRGFTAERGDIVTIDREKFNGSKEPLIKRVIALEGDRLLFMYDKDGKYIDVYLCKKGKNTFALCNEPYVKEKMNRNNYKSIKVSKHIVGLTDIDLDDEANISNIKDCIITVPAGKFFFMGDNRNDSNDSRGDYSMFDRSEITGKVIKIVKPYSATHKMLELLYGSETK